MTKSELKKFVQVYAEVKESLFERSEVAKIVKRNRKERIEIKAWMYKFPKYLSMVEGLEDNANTWRANIYKTVWIL